MQVTGYDAGTTYKLTINGKVIGVIAAGSVNATATALAAAWEASTEAEPSEVAAAAATDTVTFTAGTAGVEFTLTSSVSGGAGTIGAFTTTTANSGVNDVSVATNWDIGAIPTAGDTVYIDHNDVSLLWNLDQSGAGTVTTLQINQSFTAPIGLPEVNEDATAYPEYRAPYYKLRTTNLIVGRGPGQGSGRIKIDSDSVQVAAVIENTGTGLESDIPALLWKGTHASNAMSVKGNSQVGVAFFQGEAATIATLTADESADIRCGAGATLTTINAYGNSRIEVNGAIAGTLTVLDNAVVTINGTGVVAVLVIRDNGQVIYNTTGTLGGDSIVSGNGVLDFDQDPRAKTVTNPIDVYGAGSVLDSNKVVSSLVVDYNEMTVLTLGTNVRVTRGTPA